MNLSSVSGGEETGGQTPQWMKKPSGHGLWVTMQNQYRKLGYAVVMRLTAEELREGQPFGSDWCYGPIPEPPVETEVTT